MPLRRQHRNTNVIYYSSHDEGIIKALLLCWAKYIQRMHPWGQVSHRNAADYFKKVFQLFTQGISSAPWTSHTPGPHLLHSGWGDPGEWLTKDPGHCHPRLLGHLPELRTAGTKHDKTDGWGWEYNVHGWHSVNTGGRRRPLQQPQFKRSHETSQIVLSKPAVPNSFWRIMEAQHWLKLMFVISRLILCLRPNQKSIQAKSF